MMGTKARIQSCQVGIVEAQLAHVPRVELVVIRSLVFRYPIDITLASCFIVIDRAAAELETSSRVC